MYVRFIPIILLACFVVTGGCGSFGNMYRPEYDLVISEVHGKRKPEPSIVTSVPLPTEKGTSLEDDWLAWDWKVNDQKLDVELRNKTDVSLTIRWDLSTFSSVSGTKHLVYVKPKDREHRKAATSLNPGSTGRESVYPGDYQPLIPYMPGIATTDREKADDFARQQLGKSLVVTVPVESSGKKLREYTIVFTVDSYHLRRIFAM